MLWGDGGGGGLDGLSLREGPELMGSPQGLCQSGLRRIQGGLMVHGPLDLRRECGTTRDREHNKRGKNLGHSDLDCFTRTKVQI